MVNKAALGVLGVVVLASLGVGVLIGMQLGSGGTAAVPSDGSTDGAVADGTATTTANETEEAANATAPTVTRTQIAADQFNEDRVADWVLQFVNDARTDEGREPFSGSGTTARTVARMADNHSEQMAVHASVAHTIDGVSIGDRYERYNIADACTFKDASGKNIYEPTDSKFEDEFEVIALTYAGQKYEHNGTTRFNENERAVARAIVDDWLDDPEPRERVLRQGPTRLGVGVSITQNGKVYASANVCA